MKTEMFQGDRVTWSESVRVNIGDYEHRDIHLSLSTTLREGESHEKAIARARKRVQASLQRQERKIRLNSKENVEFDTMSRLRV